MVEIDQNTISEDILSGEVRSDADVDTDALTRSEAQVWPHDGEDVFGIGVL